MNLLLIAVCMAVITFLSTFVVSPWYNLHEDQPSILKIVTSFIVLLFTYLLLLQSIDFVPLQRTNMIFILVSIFVVTAAIIDGWYMVIPDRLIITFIPSLLLFQLLNGNVIEGILGGAFAFILLLSMAIISRGGIGGGDIKLFTAIGLGTSFTFIYQLLLFSCLIAFFIGLFARFSGKREKGEMVAFGPTIALTTILLIYFY